MNHVRRTALATLAAGALLLTPVGAAHASHGKDGGHVRTQVKQVIKDITVKDKALARLEGSRRVTRLADENEAVLVDSIESDRAALADLRSAAAAADTTYDARAVRKEVRGYRVEVYVQAVSIVRHAEELSVEAADDAEALALVDLALDAALALDSHSAKAELRVAREYLDQAEAALDDSDDDGDETEEPVEPVG